MNNALPKNEPTTSGPWWRYPLVWLVISGPAAVVIASIVTIWLAWRTPEVLVSEDYYREGIELTRTLADKMRMPAQAGRNHAATPEDDVPLPKQVAP